MTQFEKQRRKPTTITKKLPRTVRTNISVYDGDL